MYNEPKNFIVQRVAPWLLGFYFIAVFMLFLAELGVLGLQNYLRATNQVLILLVLLILPVVVIGMSRFIHKISIKVSGQELQMELMEVRQQVKVEVQNVEAKLGGQISDAEQALWPLLAGKDLESEKRLNQKKLVIGSKQDTSQLFFAYLLKLCIEKFVPGALCQVRFPNGGSMKNFADLQHRWIDMYIDSSGTCCQYFNIDHHTKSDQQILNELNTYGQNLGITWFPTLGASEDYCLVMARDKAEQVGVKSIRDLKLAASQLAFSADAEFLNRPDCYIGMQKYGIDFKAVSTCRVEKRYDDLQNHEADVFVGYETDPELYKGDVIRLSDPDEFFPRYLAIPAINTQALELIPELLPALDKLHLAITTTELVQAVNKLSLHQQDPDIAKGLAQEVINRL